MDFVKNLFSSLYTKKERDLGTEERWLQHVAKCTVCQESKDKLDWKGKYIKGMHFYDGFDIHHHLINIYWIIYIEEIKHKKSFEKPEENSNNTSNLKELLSFLFFDDGLHANFDLNDKTFFENYKGTLRGLINEGNYSDIYEKFVTTHKSIRSCIEKLYKDRENSKNMKTEVNKCLNLLMINRITHDEGNYKFSINYENDRNSMNFHEINTLIHILKKSMDIKLVKSITNKIKAELEDFTLKNGLFVTDNEKLTILANNISKIINDNEDTKNIEIDIQNVKLLFANYANYIIENDMDIVNNLLASIEFNKDDYECKKLNSLLTKEFSLLYMLHAYKYYDILINSDTDFKKDVFDQEGSTAIEQLFNHDELNNKNLNMTQLQKHFKKIDQLHEKLSRSLGIDLRFMPVEFEQSENFETLFKIKKYIPNSGPKNKKSDLDLFSSEKNLISDPKNKDRSVLALMLWVIGLICNGLFLYAGNIIGYNISNDSITTYAALIIFISFVLHLFSKYFNSSSTDQNNNSTVIQKVSYWFFMLTHIAFISFYFYLAYDSIPTNLFNLLLVTILSSLFSITSYDFIKSDKKEKGPLCHFNLLIPSFIKLILIFEYEITENYFWIIFIVLAFSYLSYFKCLLKVLNFEKLFDTKFKKFMILLMVAIITITVSANYLNYNPKKYFYGHYR